VRELSRRRALAAAGGVVLGGLSGCTETNAVRYRVDSPAPFVDSDPEPPASLEVLAAEPSALFQRLLVGEPTAVVEPAANRPRRIFVHNAVGRRRGIEIEVAHDWTFGEALVVRGDVSFPAGGVFVVELYPPADYAVTVGAPPTAAVSSAETLQFDRRDFDCNSHAAGVTVGEKWALDVRSETADREC
jgi:hypothetical protein